MQSVLEPLGVTRLPELYGFPGAALALILFSFPYVVLSVRGALLRLDPAYEEVSRSLGRGAWRTFWSVTLPQLRPAIAAGGLLGKKKPKRKLVISGVAPDDVRAFEAVKSWCEVR